MNHQQIDILLVEDNPGDAFLLQEQLKQTDRIKYSLNCVDYLQAAIESLEQQSFNIVLLDLTLPDSRGINTFIEIQDANPHIPVILLTGSDDRNLATQAIHQGAQDYLIKGHTSGELIVQAIQYAIERKQNQEHLEQQIQELEGFSYMVSHDLKNPLSAIKGLSFLLKESYSQHRSKRTEQETEQEEEYIDYIIQSCSRMEHIIGDLTILSQVQHTELEIEPVDISVFVEQIIHQLQREQPERQVEFIIAPQVHAHGHPSLIKIVLENLLNNAWKYSSKEVNSSIEFGTLSAQNLKLKHSQAQNFISPDKSLPDDRPIYFIRDNGVGFDPQKADRLFAPFNRLHGRGEFPGTGIGLAIVKRIIERHEGEIWFDAEVDQGATFYFILGKDKNYLTPLIQEQVI